MFVEFENRSGEMEQADMEIDEPCPICCGMLFPVVESKPESGLPLQQLADSSLPL